MLTCSLSVQYLCIQQTVMARLEYIVWESGHLVTWKRWSAHGAGTEIRTLKLQVYVKSSSNIMTLMTQSEPLFVNSNGNSGAFQFGDKCSDQWLTVSCKTATDIQIKICCISHKQLQKCWWGNMKSVDYHEDVWMLFYASLTFKVLTVALQRV